MARRLRDIPPVRRDFLTPDPDGDSERLAWMDELWDSQDSLLAGRNRQVEENVRMVAGQHWTFFEKEANRFVDVREFLTPDERRWRAFPTINVLFQWFMLTHSRLTENPPLVTFLPATGDDLDYKLAETWDTIHKILWREQDMEDVNDRLMRWVICGGRGYLKSRIDPSRGELTPVPALDDHDPLAAQTTPGGFGVPLMPEGGITTDVLAGPEVRSEWGPLPFHEKRWHMHRSFLSPERVWEVFSTEVDATTTRSEIGTDLHSILYGAGHYGAAGRSSLALLGAGGDDEELVQVDELWMAPLDRELMAETDRSPGGRLMIRVGDKLFRDGPRPARFDHTSPIRSFDFVGVPGRPEGTSPQEMLNPVQRMINRLYGQALEYANRVTNPKAVIHQTVGIEQWSENPTEPIVAAWGPGVNEPIFYLKPPPLGQDVYNLIELLELKFDELGSMRGSQSREPASGISGEQLKELRFNADRPINTTARRAAVEYGRLSDDWRAWIAVLWDEERVIEYAGEDRVMQTLQVRPELFSGKINAFPDTESMLPEGRGERRAQAFQLFEGGFFGAPDTPAARRRFIAQARFPHLARDLQPGAIDRRTAQQAMAEIVRGGAAEDVNLFRWYDFSVWRDTLTEFMSSPEFLRLDPPAREQMALLYELVIRAQQAQAVEAAAQVQETQAQAVFQGVVPPDTGAAPTTDTRPRQGSTA